VMSGAIANGEFTRGLRVQGRVIGALIMREIITRYGRHNIAFMWIFIEPMLFTSGVVLVWTVVRSHATQLPLVPFTITGYASVLLWRNTISRCGNAVEPNRALLHHRNVRVIDLYLARLILEAAGASISFMALTALMMGVGLMAAPDDIFKMIVGWALLAWFAMSMGLVIGSVSTISESFERVWHVFTYLFLPLSGAFFMVDWIPKHLQSWALLIPTVDCVELLRDGYFGAHVHAHFDLPYTLAANTVVTLLGLILVKRLARTVEGA
jgi:capsular polysaccharide transport system permease protein